MIELDAADGAFEAFMEVAHPRLLQAFVARYGPVDGADAAGEAMAWAFANQERLEGMANPIGYLYRVGQTKTRRIRRRTPLLPDVNGYRTPEVEPGLAPALRSLSTKQRTVVILHHGFDWSLAEIAELIGVSKSTVQSHLGRAMERLRQSLGEESE